MNLIEQFKAYQLIPVVTIPKIEDAEKMLAGLVEGGLPVAEVCFRTDCAEEAIKLAVKEYPQMLVGARTVINGEQCERAIKAGAKFIVSPGLSEEVAAACKAHDIFYLPGVVTATEIVKALSLGLTTVKFFPAENFGGLKTIKALSAAFPQLTFVPTGGVNENNILDYLAFPKIVACGGSWIMKGDIAQNCRAVCEKLRSVQ